MHFLASLNKSHLYDKIKNSDSVDEAVIEFHKIINSRIIYPKELIHIVEKCITKPGLVCFDTKDLKLFLTSGNIIIKVSKNKLKRFSRTGIVKGIFVYHTVSQKATLEDVTNDLERVLSIFNNDVFYVWDVFMNPNQKFKIKAKIFINLC